MISKDMIFIVMGNMKTVEKVALIFERARERVSKKKAMKIEKKETGTRKRRHFEDINKTINLTNVTFRGSRIVMND